MGGSSRGGSSTGGPSTGALNLTEPGFFLRDDYYDVLARLRRESPVARCDDGSWAVSRYDEVREISRDPARFVSSRGVLINDPLRAAGSTGELDMFSIIHLDPPVHALYRTLVNREFTPRAVLRLEDEIRATVRRVLDEVPTGEPIDFVDHVSSPIPIAVIAEFFGVPDADRALFRRWSDKAIEAFDLTPEEVQEQGEVFGVMATFLMEHIDSPVADSHDLLSLLKSSDLDGRPLTRGEIMGFCMTLLVAGNETTRTLISGGVEALADHPDQRAELVADPSLIPGAVEEMLRWVTPIQAFGRTAVVDVELAGQHVEAGEFVIMLYASANRDESVFGETADRFDVHREVVPTHVAFGFGEHLCLGASLARLETRVFFEEFLARFPTYELAGPVERTPSTLVRGARRMPVVL